MLTQANSDQSLQSLWRRRKKTGSELTLLVGVGRQPFSMGDATQSSSHIWQSSYQNLKIDVF